MLTRVLVELSGSRNWKSCIIRNAVKLEFQLGDLESFSYPGLANGDIFRESGGPRQRALGSPASPQLPPCTLIIIQTNILSVC